MTRIVYGFFFLVVVGIADAIFSAWFTTSVMHNQLSLFWYIFIPIEFLAFCFWVSWGNVVLHAIGWIVERKN